MTFPKQSKSASYVGFDLEHSSQFANVLFLPGQQSALPLEIWIVVQAFFETALVQKRSKQLESMRTKVCLVIAGLSIVVLGLSGCGAYSTTANPRPTPSHASSKFLYVVNSIEATVQGFSIDAATGELTPAGTAVPADQAPIYAAATGDGRYLYVANAGTTRLVFLDIASILQRGC